MEIAGELFRRRGNLHLAVVDIKFMSPSTSRFAIPTTMRRNVVVLRRLEPVSNKHALKKRRSVKNLIANNIALAEQAARIRISDTAAGWQAGE